ncbi:MAG: tetratricopeptide repeat protein [Elusimicrobia bacterium]|nr:tetratricopeptide repeat protein [Elusimicrobiota bacterium]
MTPSRTDPIRGLPDPTPARLFPAALAAAAVAFLVYLPSLANGFVNWDDRAMLFENPGIRDLGWGSLKWMLTTDHMSAYQPLGWLGCAVIIKVQGLRPFGFHLAGALFHAANTGLFLLLAWKLLVFPVRARPPQLPGASEDGRAENDLARLCGAAFASLLFGLHPLQVETVAWATGFSDLLGTLFFLLSLTLYLESVEREGRRRNVLLALSLAAFSASGLSRWKGVFLPVVVGAVNFFPLRRFEREPRPANALTEGGRDARLPAWTAPRRVWAELAAFSVLAAAVVLANAAAKIHGAGYGLHLRPVEAGSAAMLYAWKTVWPADLIPLYELGARGAEGGIAALLPLALAAAVTAGAVVLRRSFPAAPVLWLCFLAAVAPPFALKGPGPVFAQDLHAYLACAVFYLAAGGLLAAGLARSGPVRKAALFCVSGAILLALGTTTLRQARVWKDSVSLWTHTLAVDSSSHPARVNLAAGLLKLSRDDDAMIHLREQLARHPDDGVARFNLDQVVKRRGSSEPDMAHFHNNLGADLFNLGRLEDAAYHLTKALSLAPDAAGTHANLTAVLLGLGRVEEARRHHDRLLGLSRSPREARSRGAVP